ncbi:hypothetical protein BDZ85DRAFT_319478 [Elsinoe ampelina]|uniref:Zinc finger PHD-type domain-containing protein n=1 Tax=Elsinoe ampelina TaxID=302913 RepID=A0A6A6GCV9_9PEZI|nr:hypothetical protein BDZ85DRAFT_319478 [Elsinoe ampelina]
MPLESGFRQGYLGTVSLNSTLEIAERVSIPHFLQRNIRQTLDAHDHVRRSKGALNDSRRQQSCEDKMPPRRRHDWFPVKKEILQCAREPTMQVLPFAIVSRGSTRPVPKNDGATKVKAEPEWLPAPDTQKLKCEIQCMVQKRSDVSKWAAVQHETKPATLICTRSDDGKPSITIELDAPFILPLSILSRSGEGGDEPVNGADNSRDLQNHRLKLHISCSDLTMKKDLHTFMYGQDISAVPFGVHAPLRAFIKGLDKLGGKDLVQLTSGRVGTTEQTGYELAVDLKWNKYEGSVLERTMRSRREAAVNGSVIKTTQESAQEEHEITYIIKGSAGQLRSLVVDDLRCQFCKKRLPHSSFDRLHMHYVLNHDHLDFSITQSRVVNGVQQKTLLLQLNERPRLTRASNDVPDEREMEWVRPVRPFDLSQYLKGDDSWTSCRATGRRVRPRSPGREISTAQLKTYGPAKEVPPAEIQQSILPRKRKRYQVPEIPDVELYRQTSKRPLEAGEELSESDEESEDDWAAQKQKLRKTDLQGESRGELFKVFDQYIHRERISSDKHLQHAVIRFAKAHHKQLRRPLVFRDWKTKLKQLRLTGLLSSLYHDFCIELCTKGGDGVEEPPANGSPSSTETPKTNGLTNGHTNIDIDRSSQSQIRRTLQQWSTLPLAPNAPNAHPLTGHPKIQNLLGLVAIHPSFQPLLFSILHSPQTRHDASQTLQSIVHGRTALRVYEADYESWLSALADSAPIAVHEGTCVCGQTVTETGSLIYCSNTSCPTAGFHMPCVNTPVRDPNWKCSKCAGRDTPWVVTGADQRERERLEGVQTPTLWNAGRWLEMLKGEVGAEVVERGRAEGGN